MEIRKHGSKHYQIDYDAPESEEDMMELMEKATTVVDDLIITDNSTGSWRSETNTNLDLWTLKSFFTSESWVYIIINSLARKGSSSPFLIYRDTVRDGEMISQPNHGHALNKRLQRPNKWETTANFKYKMFAELGLMGNCIIWDNKADKSFVIIPTQLILMEFNNDNGDIKNYQVLGSSQADIYNKNIKMKLDPEDVIHIKLPSLNTVYWGDSPLISGRKPVMFDRYSKEYLINFYQKQALPGMMLEMGDKVNEKQAMRMLRSFELQYTGRRNQRRTMILPKGITAQAMAHKISEQDLKEHVELNKDEILGLYQFPRHELGIQKTGSLGTSETRQQIANFWNSTLIPFQDLIADGFSEHFRKELKEKNSFGWDNSDVPALQEDLKEKAELTKSLADVLTVNERRGMWEKEPIEGGDVIGSVKPATQPQKPNIVEEKPEDEQTPEEPKEEKSQKINPLILDNRDWWNSRVKQENDGVDNAYSNMLSLNYDMFANFGEKSVAVVKEHLNSMQFKNDDDIPAEFVDREKIRRELDRAFGEFENEWLEEGQKILRSQVELGYDVQLNVPFNLPRQGEIEALRVEGQEGRRKTLESRLIDSFDKMSSTTTDQVMDRIEKGVKESKTIQQIAKDVASYYTDTENIKYRSERIARTETLTAVSLGQWAATKDAQEVIPGMMKMWVSAGDSRVRDSHSHLDGVKIPVDKHFSNNLMFPRDPSGDPGEVINCRCTMLMIPPEDDIIETE